MEIRSFASQLNRALRAHRRILAGLICFVILGSLCGSSPFRTAAYAVDASEVRPKSPLTLHVPEPDIYADLEAAVLWEQSFSNVRLSGDWARDLLAIAKSQIGYSESSRNFAYFPNLAGDGYVILGWTRYGAWYGYPYGDWCAMFVSFCLHYAGIGEEDFPYECENAAWVDRLWEIDRFADAGDYMPKPGDLIFFDRERDQIADHVGLVCDLSAEDNWIRTIEGNHTVRVDYFDYRLDDRTIMGYGILPENPHPVEETEEEEAVPPFESPPPENLSVPEITLVRMPAQDFKHSAGGIDVRVSAPEGAFPEGSWMYAMPVNGNLLRSAVAEAVDGEVLEVQAIDIKFYDSTRRVIEPRVPIRVTITPVPSQYDGRDTCVVHIDDTGEADLLELAEDAEAGDRELVFDTLSFSIYAVAYVSEK